MSTTLKSVWISEQLLKANTQHRPVHLHLLGIGEIGLHLLSPLTRLYAAVHEAQQRRMEITVSSLGISAEQALRGVAAHSGQYWRSSRLLCPQPRKGALNLTIHAPGTAIKHLEPTFEIEHFHLSMQQVGSQVSLAISESPPLDNPELQLGRMSAGLICAHAGQLLWAALQARPMTHTALILDLSSGACVPGTGQGGTNDNTVQP